MKQNMNWLFSNSIFFSQLFFLMLKKKVIMGDETKKSHNNQKNSWNRWLCLLTYRPNLVFCSHHQSLFGTQVVFMWRMFLRLFCINRVWLGKKSWLYGQNQDMYSLKGVKNEIFFFNSHSFILQKIRIYFVIIFYLFIYSWSDSKSSPGNAERSAATDDKYSVYGIEQTMDKCFHFVLLKT